jgi:maleate cis-trans isomerase
MPSGKRIGIVIPSSNVVIEPLAVQRFGKSNDTVHFSRLGVVAIELDARSLAQFEMGEQLSAAQELPPVGLGLSMTKSIAGLSSRKLVFLLQPVFLK